MMTRKAGLLLLLTLAASVASAQGPSADWRTIETPHYRVHCPEPFEQWAEYTAARLESVFDRVGTVVGYTPAGKTDVLIMDPNAVANGSAWPFLGFPRMILFTNPPGSASVIGHYADWVELLTIHEQAHLSHLLRPSRNPRLLERVLPVGPIVRRAPRWAIEGYATVIEGELTGTGRPQSEMRAAILREWARTGRLPGYSALAFDSRSWMGQAMAYLVGSAYLEWLQEREGKESLRNLWRRITARHDRSFDEAFEGVFGDSPATLYARFRAELTHETLELEKAVEERQGELWQDFSWTTGRPAVSPDGERIALVRRHRDDPSKLVVLKTSEDEEAEKEYQEKLTEILEADPEDVAPVRTKPLPREPEHTLVAYDGAELYTPRWMPDGKSILFVRFEPDSEGFLHPDVFQWFPESGSVERLTVLADLREPDPLPDGRSIVAVRNRFGKSQLVHLDLSTRDVAELTPATIQTVWDHPRVDPSGERIAVVRHEARRWELLILPSGGGEARTVDLPVGTTTVAQPAWSSDGSSIHAVLGSDGLLEIWRLDPDNRRPPFQVTRSLAASLAPAPAPDDSLFFLGLDVDGYDLRRIELADLPELDPVPAEAFVAVRRPELPAVIPEIEVAEVPPSRPYGIGRQEWMTLPGGTAAPSGGTIEAGVRIGDLVGRLETIAAGAIALNGGAEGLALRSEWRGWPVIVRGHLYGVEETVSDQPEQLASIGTAFDAELYGLEVGLSWSRLWRNRAVVVEGGLLGGRRDAGPDLEQDQAAAYAEFRFVNEPRYGTWRFGQKLAGRWTEGETEGDRWSHVNGALTLTAGTKENRMSWRYARNASESAAFLLDKIIVGGLEGSLMPNALRSNRIEVPALPRGILVGDDHESHGVRLELGALPLTPFYERHRTWVDRGAKGEWLELAGVELAIAVGRQPVLKIPAADIHLGVARILSGELEDEVEWWIGLRWRE